MKSKILLIAVLIVMMLTGCDKIISLPDERIFAMVNDVGAEYGLTFESDNFDTPESTVLIIYAPETFYSSGSLQSSEVPYTEILVDDFTKLGSIYEPLLFSDTDKTISILMYHGSDIDNEIYKVNDRETVSLKKYDITVPLGNIVERNSSSEALRYIILIPEWSTFGTGFFKDKSDTDNLYQGIFDNFSSVMEKVSRYIDFTEFK